MAHHVEELNSVDSDITRLAKHAKNIEDAFWKVELGFRKAMKVALPERTTWYEKLWKDDANNSYYAELERLLNESLKHKREYVRLRDESRTVAKTASEDLRELFGPLASCIGDPALTVPQKQDKLTSFRMTVSTNQSRANQMAHAFEDLRDAVKYFAKEVEKLADKCREDLNTTLQPQIEQLKNGIQKLYDGLKAFTALHIGKAGLAVGGMYGACKMAYFILCIFAPEFYLAAAVVGTGVVAVMLRPVAKKYKELWDQQWELKKAIAAKEGAEHVAAALAGLQGDLALVVKTLGVFTHVWDVVDAALTGMEKQAASVEKRYVAIPTFADPMLQNVLGICRPLEAVMRTYAGIPEKDALHDKCSAFPRIWAAALHSRTRPVPERNWAQRYLRISLNRYK